MNVIQFDLFCSAYLFIVVCKYLILVNSVHSKPENDKQKSITCIIKSKIKFN